MKESIDVTTVLEWMADIENDEPEQDPNYDPADEIEEKADAHD